MTNDDVATLNSCIVDMPAADLFSQLSKSGKTPVCLFPTRKECDNFNNKMLKNLPNKVHDLACVDNIDETASTQKWSKKAQAQ